MWIRQATTTRSCLYSESRKILTSFSLVVRRAGGSCCRRGRSHARIWVTLILGITLSIISTATSLIWEIIQVTIPSQKLFFTKFTMMFSIIFLLSGVLAASLETRQTTSCTTPNGAGYCGNTANGCSGGTFYAGFCPGASNIQCCVVPCSTPSGSGHCQYTTSTCSGSFVSGYCPGASNYQVSSQIPLKNWL